MPKEPRPKKNPYERVANKRKKYIEDLKNNTLYNRRLYFLIRTMKELNYTKKELGDITGISPTLLNWKVETDECFLSEAHTLMKAMGMKLTIEFVQKEEQHITETRNDNNELTIQMPNHTGTINLKSPNTVKELKNNISNQVLEKRMKEGGITKFIVEFILKRGLAFTAFCKTAKLNYQSIRENLDKDEFKISHIYKIAENFNQKIHWNITPIENN